MSTMTVVSNNAKGEVVKPAEKKGGSADEKKG